MATSRIAADTVTLFNFLGKGEDRADRYQATVLENVHAAAAEGQIKTANTAEDALKVLIFDANLRVPSGREFLPHRAFAARDPAERASFWTLSPDGKDYVAPGALETTDGRLPEGVTLYQVQKIQRHAKGSARMMYWTVEAT